MFRISCSAMTFCQGQPQAPVTLLGMANTPGKQWLWRVSRGQGRGISQPDQSQLPPVAGINGSMVHKQAVCPAFGTQVIITTLVFSPSPRSSPGPAVASGATKSDVQPPRQVGLQAVSLWTSTLRHLQLTLLEASMNFTPLYVMDRIMVGIFFMCSVDFFRNENIQVTNCEWMVSLHPSPPHPRDPQACTRSFRDLRPGGGKLASGGSREEETGTSRESSHHFPSENTHSSSAQSFGYWEQCWEGAVQQRQWHCLFDGLGPYRVWGTTELPPPQPTSPTTGCK